MSRVLVTGASGALAGYVIPRVQAAGHHVSGFDLTHRAVAATPDLFIQGDLTSYEDCLRAIGFARPEVIIHLGAIPFPTELAHARPGRHHGLPEDATMRINTMGTYYLLEAAARIGGVQRVVFASTYYVLGLGNRLSGTPYEVEYLPIDEDHPLRPEDSYSISKLFGEELLRAYARIHGIRGIAFRLMGVHYQERPHEEYGADPKPRPGHVGGPEITSYQYVDARDVAEACTLAIDAEGLDDFEAFYLTTDTVYSQPTQELVRCMWPDLVPLAGGLAGTEGIISDRKVREKLGYMPRYSWRGTD